MRARAQTSKPSYENCVLRCRLATPRILEQPRSTQPASEHFGKLIYRGAVVGGLVHEFADIAPHRAHSATPRLADIGAEWREPVRAPPPKWRPRDRLLERLADLKHDPRAFPHNEDEVCLFRWTVVQAVIFTTLVLDTKSKPMRPAGSSSSTE
jgi:hypothetical protein